MMFFLTLLNSLLYSLTRIDETGSAQSQVRVVSSHRTVELYYKLLTENRVDFGHPMFAPDEEVRVQMCHDVFSSGYFDMLGEEPISVDDAYTELRNNHEHIFNTLHRKSRTVTEQKLTRVTDVRMIDNIRLFDKQYSRTYDYVFTCLTRNRRTGGTHVYFVSERFNVAVSAPMTHNTGYFILAPESENVTQVRAIAEYAARTLVTDQEDLEMLYLAYRRDNEFAEDYQTDPVCRLAKLHKIRICGAALNSSFFENKVQFLPNENLLVGKCRLMDVSLRTEAARRLANGVGYKEWMLWCPTEVIREDGRIEYFISRADKSKEVFVYTRDYSTRKIFLENLSEGIAPISTGTYAIPRVVDLT